jgi:hypothetical protein
MFLGSKVRPVCGADNLTANSLLLKIKNLHMSTLPYHQTIISYFRILITIKNYARVPE